GDVVHRVKRHTAVTTGDMRFHPLVALIAVTFFIPRQVVALSDIVHQFLHQNRGKTLAVVLNRPTDITDVKLVLRGNKRLKEEVAVIITTATVAPLRCRAHEIKAQRRQGSRIYTVIHTKQTHHFEGNGTHGHQRADIDRPGKEALADTLLIEAQGQFIPQKR